MNQANPTPKASTATINWFTLKKYLAKATSIALLASAIRGFVITISEIFAFSSLVQQSSLTASGDATATLKIFIIETLRVLVEATYGLVLFLKPTEKLRLLHIILGLVLFFLPFAVSDSLIRKAQDSLFSARIEKILAQEASEAAAPQATLAEQFMNDYQFQFQNYRTAHTEYLSDKNAYLTFQTLNSRETAIESTKKLLTARAETLRTYLRALRTRLEQTPSITAPTKADIASSLEQEESFLIAHQAQISEITSLEAIAQVSLSLQDRYPEMQTLAYTTLYTILRGEQTDLSFILTREQQNLQTLVDQNASELNSERISQWLEDTKNTLAENETTFVEAEKQLSGIKPSKNLRLTNQRTFAKVLNLLEQTRSRLIQVVSFTQEIINRIKYG